MKMYLIIKDKKCKYAECVSMESRSELDASRLRAKLLLKKEKRSPKSRRILYLLKQKCQHSSIKHRRNCMLQGLTSSTVICSIRDRLRSHMIIRWTFIFTKRPESYRRSRRPRLSSFRDRGPRPSEMAKLIQLLLSLAGRRKPSGGPRSTKTNPWTKS